MIARAAAVLASVLWLVAAPAAAGDNYALVVSGASGGEVYAKKYDDWRRTLVTTLTSTLGYPSDHVVALSESSSAKVQQAIADLRVRMMNDDQLCVVLIGHGTAGDGVAKFNLAGPDMSAADWAVQLKTVPGRLIFVDTTSASFPFLRQLAAPGRIVITATDAAAQEFETVFPDFFIKAFADPSADGDKDGRVSIFEAFLYASANVRIWFDQHNQLPTERALLDDDGDGVGREAWNPEPDGAVARATYLQAGSGPQNEIELAIAALKARRSAMAPAAYDAELERLLTELATLSAQSRGRP
jgi:hypothetical protein